MYITIGNLLTQDDQVRCVANAARHLSDDGTFVVETGTGWGWSKGRSDYVDAEEVGSDHVVLDVNRFGWWDRRPFDADCASHVSVYRRA